MAERATTDKQQRILDVIRSFTAEHKYPPSVREIGERVGLSSSSTVQSHLKTLERRGLLRRDPTKPRALVASPEEGAPPYVDSVTLPILGRVAAGVPITAAENLEDHFVLPASWAPRSGGFLLRVKGDSMIEAGILDGDTVLIRKGETAENGQIVVALVDDAEVTLKRLRRRGNSIALEPCNVRHETRIFPADRVKVQGRLVALLRRY